MTAAQEVNFDGLVGPTHHYAGLSFGNLPSMSNSGRPSNPRAAALQGLEKAKRLLDLGILQAVLPPHERPDIPALKNLGFSGTDQEILEKAARDAPELLAACASASSMWAANSATVTPSADADDGAVHFTPANLSSELHRSLEAEFTSRVLKRIFPEGRHFAHHPPLPAGRTVSDEGAANHTRFCPSYEKPGIHLFVYGRTGAGSGAAGPARFPARQTFEASAAVARRHRIRSESVFFARQSPESIDAGAFHADVVATGNRNVFLFHESAFVESGTVVDRLNRKYSEDHGENLCLFRVRSKEVSLEESVRTYLFNSQIVGPSSGGMTLIAPEECRQSVPVSDYLGRLVEDHDNPIHQIRFVDLKESMQNGGGPACLRLRVVLNEEELRRTHSGIFLDDALWENLCGWVKKHYRDRLSPRDLADPSLLLESRRALDELTGILGLGPIYPFQLNP